MLVASLAALAMAAPTPNQSLAKRSFAVPVKGHQLRAPAEEMFRAYRKHGWHIIFLNPEDGSFSPYPPQSSASSPSFPGSYGDAPSSSSPAVPGGYGQQSSSAAPPYPIPSDSSLASPGSTGIVPPYPSGGPSGAPVGTGTGAPVATATGAPVPSNPLPSGTAPSNSTAPPTPTGGSPTGDGDTAEVTTTPEQYESEYLSPVSIGGQELNLNLDTGSGDLWVFSTELPGTEGSGHALYDPTKSSTYSQYEGATWQIQYGDGSTAAGIVGYDQVAIGGATVTKQAVELATEVAAQFLRDENSDGIVGLSFSVLNTVQPQPQKTWFENVQDSLDAPLFTADLEEDASGTYEFGTIDQTKYSGEINYTPIDNSDGWWQFPSKYITIGGQQQQCTICSPAIADTGTSLLLLDDDVVDAYYAQVEGAQYDSMQGGYVYQCTAQLPDFGVAIGSNYVATLTGEEITYAEVGNGTCFGGVQGNGASQGSGTPVQIIGVVLLKQYFAVFDGGNLQFGIAKKN